MRLGKKSKSFWRQMKMNSQQSKTYGHAQDSKGNPDREVHRDTGLPKKKRRRKETSQINNLTLHLQELEEQQQRQPRAHIRKETTKIRVN